MAATPRILLNSDLHLDSGMFSLPQLGEPAIAVFAGDTTDGPTGMSLLRELTDLPIVAVAGNHDFWGADYYEALAQLRSSAKTANVHFLENQSVVLDGVRFLGATFWTDYCDSHPALLHYGLWRMKDHQRIGAKRWWTAKNRSRFVKAFGEHALEQFDGQFNPLLARELHQASLVWLRKQLDTPFSGPTVVVTHHAPTHDSLLRAGVISESALNPAFWQIRREDDMGLAYVGSYASDALAKLPVSVERTGIKLWVHGHVHRALRYGLQGLTIACNPRGRVYKPLTKEDCLGFALYGYRVTDQNIAESEARFAADPERGDGGGYQRGLLLDLAEDGYSLVAGAHQEALAALERITAEAKALRPLAKSARQPVADLAGHRADTLRQQAIQVMQHFASDMAAQLAHWPSGLPGLASTLHHCQLTTGFELNGIENTAGYDWVISDRDREDRAFCGPRSTLAHVQSLLVDLTALRKCLNRVPTACKALTAGKYLNWPQQKRRKVKKATAAPDW